MKILAYIKLLRPHQWIKNSFVLIGIVFGQAFHDMNLLISGLQLALAFCFMSSCVYIYNDIHIFFFTINIILLKKIGL